MDYDYALRLVKEKMEAEWISQSDIAKTAGISRQRVHLVMSGKSHSRKTLRMMVRALDLEKEVRAPSIY